VAWDEESSMRRVTIRVDVAIETGADTPLDALAEGLCEEIQMMIPTIPGLAEVKAVSPALMSEQERAA
jgi:hypothetical protein